ncbi:MAG: hypothetical protein ISR65_05250 [Bacteriovoracaceae bacterium]|nr:hypothetical protein [Bacteriovoracaceae bacterium]
MNIETQLDEINNKLAVLTSEMDHQKQVRLMLEGLKEELTIISKEAMGTAITSFEGVSEHLTLDKLGHMTKVMAQNTDNMTLMVERMGMVNDLVEEVTPIFNDVVKDSILKFDEAHKKGYFKLFNALNTITLKTLDSFSDEDIKKLEDNSDMIANTLKNLANPELLGTVNCSLEAYNEFNQQKVENVSIFKMIGMLTSAPLRKFALLGFQIVQKIMNYRIQK